MKVEQFFFCHHVIEKRKVPLATLGFQGDARSSWTQRETTVRMGRKLEILNWDVFRPVDLGRLRAQPQPSTRDSFPLVTCGFLQRRTKGRPSGRLHSDAQVSQQETPKTMHLRIAAPRMAL